MTTKQTPIHGLISIFKQVGETPLQCLDRLRLEHPEYKNETLSYAGRLDPLASGLLLVLVGAEANRDREKYLGLDKTYEVEVLFGVSTDTYDVLGLINEIKAYDVKSLDEKVNAVVKDVSIFSNMEYPPYSSKPVNGKSLFQWAREGRLNEILIPKQEGSIKDIKILSSEVIEVDNLKKKVESMIGAVKGDFRQVEILDKWKQGLTNKEYLVIKFNIESESGAYMRSFAHKLGEAVGVPALALTILRTKVGSFDLALI